jgi:hypothetical protein
MKKNIIIALLLIGLLISAYFNYHDSKKVKIEVGTGTLNAIFSGNNDSIASSGGIPHYDMIYSAEIPVCTGDGVINTSPCNNVIDNTHRGPVTHPTLDSIFSLLHQYKNIQIRMKFN